MKWLSFRGRMRTVLILFVLMAAMSAHALNLRPSTLNLQCGGGMGLPTIGVGWQYGRSNNFETEVMVGLIPKYDSSSAKVTFALKENFVPWHIALGSGFTLEPLTTSFYVTTIVSNKFWVKLPSRYQSGYYGLPTKIRLNICLGQRIAYSFKRQDMFVKAVSAFYELGTCDIYLLSAFGNKYLTPFDWLQLCLGVRLQI